MPFVRRSSIWYFVWASREGRVQRVEDGIIIWFPLWDYAALGVGLRGRKYISDVSIVSISRSPPLIRIRFDGSDEIIMMDDILDDFPREILDRLTIWVDERIDEPHQKRIDAMVERQAPLGPVSWRFGRLGGKRRTIRAVRTRQILILISPAILVLLGDLVRRVV